MTLRKITLVSVVLLVLCVILTRFLIAQPASVYDPQQLELRDRFAAAAVIGYIQTENPEWDFAIKYVAKLSYKIADAMIEARQE